MEPCERSLRLRGELKLPEYFARSGQHEGAKDSSKRTRKIADDKPSEAKIKFQELKHKIERQDAQIDSLKSQLLKTERVKAEIQRENHQHAIKFDRPLYPDDIVRSKFETLTKKWRKFARSNAITTFEGLKNEDLDVLIEALEMMPVVSSSRSIDLIRKAEISPSILLHALFARFICEHIFVDPLAFLRTCSLESHEGGLAGILNGIYKLGTTHSQQKAELWRTSTLALLCPSSETPNSGEDAPESEMCVLRRKYCKHLFSLFKQYQSFELLMHKGKSADKFRRDLDVESILQKALELSHILLSQRNVVLCEWYPELETEKFSGDICGIRPHQRMTLEEDDEGVETLRLDVVVEPRIVAQSIEHDETYGARRVWHKALGWSGDPAPTMIAGMPRDIKDNIPSEPLNTQVTNGNASLRDSISEGATKGSCSINNATYTLEDDGVDQNLEESIQSGTQSETKTVASQQSISVCVPSATDQDHSKTDVDHGTSHGNPQRAAPLEDDIRVVVEQPNRDINSDKDRAKRDRESPAPEQSKKKRVRTQSTNTDVVDLTTNDADGPKDAENSQQGTKQLSKPEREHQNPASTLQRPAALSARPETKRVSSFRSALELASADDFTVNINEADTQQPKQVLDGIAEYAKGHEVPDKEIPI